MVFLSPQKKMTLWIPTGKAHDLGACYVSSIKSLLYGGYAGFHSNSLVYIYVLLFAGFSDRQRTQLGEDTRDTRRGALLNVDCGLLNSLFNPFR